MQDMKQKLGVVDITEYREETRELVASKFLDDRGDPLILTDTQCDIFNLIWKKVHPRVHIETVTRFGKSLTVALAVLMRISTYPEKFSVVAGTTKQARIIMGYIIQHIFDNDYTRKKFIMEENENEESIRRYKNKDRLNFVVDRKDGKDLLGEVFITNAKGAMGFGAPNVVCFPKDALVLTSSGNLEIGKIVDEKLDVMVVSYNHKTNKQEYRQIANHYKSESDEMLEIDFGGRKLVCTNDHPIFVENKGYTKAGDLKEGDVVWASG